MHMSCSHFEEMSSNLEPGAPRFRDKIIKSADTQARLGVRSHDFPDFTAGRETPGELFLKKATAFRPEIFGADVRGARAANGPAETCRPQTGDRGNVSTADEGSTPIRRLLHQVQQVIAAMEGVAPEVDREMERAVGLLALGLAQIMVKHTAEASPDVVLNSLTKALQLAKGREIRRIRLNPEDLEPASASREHLSGLVEHFEDLRLETDAGLTRGGCVVETDYGTIDATPENQFRVLMDAFRSVMGSARSG